MAKQKDRLFAASNSKPGRFTFDERVVSVFEDMISRSVPGYQQILEMLPTLTRQFTKPEANYYDLGCSLGAGMVAIAQGLDQTAAQIIGIDSSAAMVKQARENLALLHDSRYQVIQEDLRDFEISNAALVLMNFTLQFIPLADRPSLIERIFRGLQPGGALILSEKISFADPITNQRLIDIHHQYKADQGYSELEISQKRDAIENVLIPETLDTHTHRLTEAGFTTVTPWVQNLQFISILAIKK